MSDPIGQLTTETSYDSSGNAYTLQQKGFNAFGESLGETWTIPAAQGELAGNYALTNTYTADYRAAARRHLPRRRRTAPGDGQLRLRPRL
jgi:hypothetical protein